MYHYFAFNRREFLAHYHKRSNVETTFSIIKGKFGASLRSKSDTGQVNEVLCKVLCHNVCVLVQAMHELVSSRVSKLRTQVPKLANFAPS